MGLIKRQQFVHTMRNRQKNHWADVLEGEETSKAYTTNIGGNFETSRVVIWKGELKILGIGLNFSLGLSFSYYAMNYVLYNCSRHSPGKCDERTQKLFISWCG